MPYRYVGQNPLYLGRTALATFASENRHLLLVQFDEPTHDERGDRSTWAGTSSRRGTGSG